MAKVVKKGVKPTTKKAVSKKATAKKTVKKGSKGFSKALANTPEFFIKGRSLNKLEKDFGNKGKVAKMSKNGKWYIEYKGKDGKKHREYRSNRMDYKFGI